MKNPNRHPNMDESQWQEMIAKLPPGLTVFQAAEQLGRNYNTVHRWLIRLKYPYVDGRTVWTSDRRGAVVRKIDPTRVDWSMGDSAIARQFGVSRQRVNLLRNRLRHPRPDPGAVG